MTPLTDERLCCQEVEHRVQAVLARYLYALDAEDPVILATCFAPNIEVIYHSGTDQEHRIRGHEKVLSRLAANMLKYSARTHALANIYVVEESGEAICVSHVVATLVRDQRVMVRGIRYLDRLMPVKNAWRIRRREHRPLWQYEVQRTQLYVPTSPASRKGASDPDYDAIPTR